MKLHALHALLLVATLGSLTTSRAAAAVVDRDSAALMTELTTNALGALPGLEVVSSADVRRQLELEANKQAIGCDSAATSCLAEIAGAMGAQLVVSGQLGTLAGEDGDVVILTLSLFDSAQGSAVNRVTLRDKSLAGLSSQVDDGVARLVRRPVEGGGPAAGAPRQKVLVLDIEPPRGAASVGASSPTTTSTPTPPLFIAGVSGLVGGGVITGVGVVFAVIAGERDSVGDAGDDDAVAIDGVYDQRDAFGVASVVSVVVGAAVAVAGGVALAVGGE